MTLQEAAQWFKDSALQPCSPDCEQCQAERIAYECILKEIRKAEGAEKERRRMALERLTYQKNGANYIRPKYFDERCWDCGSHGERCKQHKRELIERLAAYENSCLTPDRAAELGKADAESRTAILPPKDQRLYDVVQFNWQRSKGYPMKVLEKQPTGVNLDGTVRYVYEHFTGNIKVLGTYYTKEEAQAALERMKVMKRR